MSLKNSVGMVANLVLGDEQRMALTFSAWAITKIVSVESQKNGFSTRPNRSLPRMEKWAENNQILAG